jgi:hypothetical protein
MDQAEKSRRFVVVPKMRFSVCDKKTGAEIVQCGSETLAQWWAERLAELSSEALSGTQSPQSPV